MAKPPDKYDNQQNRADEQDRDQDMSYQQLRPRREPETEVPVTHRSPKDVPTDKLPGGA